MKAGNYLVLAGSVMLSAWPFAARGAQPATRPYTTDPDGTRHALGLKSFDGIEESVVKYVVAEDKTQPQDFKHITDEGGGLMRMFLRANAQWWDGDQGTTRKDRQRGDQRAGSPSEKWGNLRIRNHLADRCGFQGPGPILPLLPAQSTDGDKGAALITMSLVAGNKAQIRWFTGNKLAREFTFKPGEFTRVVIRVKTSKSGDGLLMASVNGDKFQGITNQPIFKDATDYRPKWGLYRGMVAGMHDDWVEHKDVTTRKVAPAP